MIKLIAAATILTCTCLSGIAYYASSEADTHYPASTTFYPPSTTYTLPVTYARGSMAAVINKKKKDKVKKEAREKK